MNKQMSLIKRTCKRRVFGRRHATVESTLWRFELRADGLVVWKNRSKKKLTLSFAQLVDAAAGQRLLKLNP